MGKRRRSRRMAVPALLVAGALSAVLGSSEAVGQGGRERLDIELFTRVGDPGQPEAIAVTADRSTVYVGTNQQERGDSDAPSRIFAHSSSGELERQFVIEGQDLSEPHGIQGIALDADGVIYALDRAAEPRVITLDPETGEQRDYARFRDVPSCAAAGREDDCSATVGDMPSAPNFPVFDSAGNLYVTDIEQALIWRVPEGGGRPEVFFTDQRLENLFGPNGIQFTSDGKTLLFALTAQSPSAGNPTEGGLFTVRVREDQTPGRLRELWRSRPFDGPDGFAIARSGNIYLALAGASQIALISPQGEEIDRAPATPLENQQLDPPVDGPASAAFLGQRVLVTNQSFPAGNPDHWAVLDVFAGEPGLPLFRPEVREESREEPPADGGGQGEDRGIDKREERGERDPGRDAERERTEGRDVRSADRAGVGAAPAGALGAEAESRLPFTGLLVAPLLILAAALIGGGLGIRRLTRRSASRRPR